MSLCTHTYTYWAGIVRTCQLCGASYDRPSSARDTDGSPEGRDAQRLDGEAATAGAEGIAEPLVGQSAKDGGTR